MKSKGRGSLHAATEPDLHTGHVLSLHGDQEEAGPRHWGWQTDSNLVPRRSALAATNVESVGVFCTRPSLRKQVTWEPWAQAARSAQRHRTPQLASVAMLPSAAED